MKLMVKNVPVVLEARREAGEKAFQVKLDAGYTYQLIDGLQALIEEVCNVTGLPAGRVLNQLVDRLL